MTGVTSALTREGDHLVLTAPLIATLCALAFTARLLVLTELFVTRDTHHVPAVLHQHDLGCIVECLLAHGAHVLELVLFALTCIHRELHADQIFQRQRVLALGTRGLLRGFFDRLAHRLGCYGGLRKGALLTRARVGQSAIINTYHPVAGDFLLLFRGVSCHCLAALSLIQLLEQRLLLLIFFQLFLLLEQFALIAETLDRIVFQLANFCLSQYIFSMRYVVD